MSIQEQKIIHLVDDDALIAHSPAMILKQEGYHVITAHSGKGAVDKARSATIDLVFTDIYLGRDKMDGTEAASTILRNHDIPVVFLSSLTENDVVDKTERITSLGYAVKDSSNTTLHDAQQKLRKTKENAERHLNVAAELTISLDTQGAVSLLNDSGHMLLRYEAGDLIGKNWFDTGYEMKRHLDFAEEKAGAER